MGFAQHPILLGAYFDFYEASPLICMVTCITGGHVIVASGFVCVFFAHWAPAKLVAWVLCQPSVWRLLVLLQMLTIQNALDHPSGSNGVRCGG
eukprot:651537-Pelagomonas_calceolata.AAC.1